MKSAEENIYIIRNTERVKFLIELLRNYLLFCFQIGIFVGFSLLFGLIITFFSRLTGFIFKYTYNDVGVGVGLCPIEKLNNNNN